MWPCVRINNSFVIHNVTGGVCRHFPGCTETTGSHQKPWPVHCLLIPQIFLTANRSRWKTVSWGSILFFLFVGFCLILDVFREHLMWDQGASHFSDEYFTITSFLSSRPYLENHWSRGQNEIQKNPAELFLSLHVYGLPWLILDVEVMTALNAKNPSCAGSGAKCFWCVHVNKILKYEQNHTCCAVNWDLKKWDTT